MAPTGLDAKGQPPFNPLLYGAPLRAFWAEDPDWTNPGDGNVLTTVRDAGSLAADLTAGTSGAGGLAPIYSSSLIGGNPGFDFRAAATTTGGYLSTASGVNGTDLTIGCVARFDNGNSTIEYAIDGRSSASARAIIGALSGSSGWRGYSSTTLNIAAGTVDTNPHLFVYRAVNNDAELWVDGVSVGTDTSGSITGFDGMVLGGNQARSGQLMNGAICYAFMYSGDVTTEDWFPTFEQRLMRYYGVA